MPRIISPPTKLLTGPHWRRPAAAATVFALLPCAALAQTVTSPAVTLEVETDRRERGLSWSDGKPALSALANVPVTGELSFDLEAATTRGSRRHGGADVGLSLTPRYAIVKGAWVFSAGVRGNMFVGRSGMSYVELTADATYTIGPARLIGAIDLAPSQAAIGGRNLHVEGQATIGLPGTAFTLLGGVGHTSGSDTDAPKAARLRPDGDYTHHHLGVEYTRRRWTAGLRYSDTSIDTDERRRPSALRDRHEGSRVVAYVRLGLTR